VNDPDDFIKEQNVFYEARIRSFTEAGALMMRTMIEMHSLNTRWFPKGMNPYEWIASKTGKSITTVRHWVNDWSTISGAQPTFVDIIKVAYLTKSGCPIELLRYLIADATPEEHYMNHGNYMRYAANSAEKLAHDLHELADKVYPLDELEKIEDTLKISGNEKSQ